MLVDPPNQLVTPGAKIGGLTCDRLARSTRGQIPPANEIEMTCQTDDATCSPDFKSRSRFRPRPNFRVVLCQHAAEIHEVRVSRRELHLKWNSDSKYETAAGSNSSEPVCRPNFGSSNIRRDPDLAVAFSPNPLFNCRKLKYEKAPHSIFDHRDFIRAQSAACSQRPAEQRDYPVC